MASDKLATGPPPIAQPAHSPSSAQPAGSAVAVMLNRPASQAYPSQRGVFAVGDVRSGSVERVASAVGEGSICVQLFHRALREL